MKRNQDRGGLWGRIWRCGLVLSLLGVSVALVAGLAGRHAAESADVVAEGWGGEATVAIA